MPSSEAVRKEFFTRMRNMWVPTNVTVVHTYYRMTRGEDTVDATKAWPEEDRLPKERTLTTQGSQMILKVSLFSTLSG